jgi:hypothetical protein
LISQSLDAFRRKKSRKTFRIGLYYGIWPQGKSIAKPLGDCSIDLDRCKGKVEQKPFASGDNISSSWMESREKRSN